MKVDATYVQPERHLTGLALSGGGFRATLFHLGSLWRLNELGILPEISQFSSVSGGAIVSGLMAVRWKRLTFRDGVATNFQKEIVYPIWDFCSRNIDRTAVPIGLVFGTWGLERSYRKYLTGTNQLRHLPNYPEFIFNATHIETGRNCTLSKRGLHIWRIGDIEVPHLPISKAIAASSACPPAFPAVTLKLPPDRFRKSEYSDLFLRDDLRSYISLTDGGAYDNLGVHAIRHCRTILVSDGSAPLNATHGKRFARQFNHRIMRPMEAAVEQTRAIRRRDLVSQILGGQKSGGLWTTKTDINNYPIQSPFSIEPQWNEYLAAIRTRLNAFTDEEKSRLINWGYVMCDLTIRSYFREEEAPPDSLPFPKFHFGAPPAVTF